MQAAMQKSSLRAAGPVRSTRAVQVHASAESRRAVLSGFVAGAALLVSKSAFAAATPVDLIDDRSVRSKGFDLIYEARELDLPQGVRDGMTQIKSNPAEAKARVAAAEARLDNDMGVHVSKKYWTEAREELRRLVGTLRFDLTALAESKPKAEKKALLALKKTFTDKVEALDFAIRQKDQASATVKLADAQKALDDVIAAL